LGRRDDGPPNWPVPDVAVAATSTGDVGPEIVVSTVHEEPGAADAAGAPSVSPPATTASDARTAVMRGRCMRLA